MTLSTDEYALLLQGFRASLGPQCMKPLVYVENDGRVVAILFASNVDRDESILLGRHAAIGFGADVVVSATDAYLKPITSDTALGARAEVLAHQRGSLLAMSDEERAEAGVLDCLAFCRVERGSNVAAGRSMPYRVTDSGVVDFLPSEHEGDHPLGGDLANDLITAMLEPTILGSIEEAVREDFAGMGVTPRQQEALQRCIATLKVLELGFGVMLYATPEEYPVYIANLPVDHPALIISTVNDEEPTT